MRSGKAFTLVELVVAVGVLAMILSVAGVIFRVTTNSHRMAIANAEIMQKLRAITDQLNADFKGLRKDGEIFVTWSASPQRGGSPGATTAYDRFDQIVFFTDGDFQSYSTSPVVRGNVALIDYMLARRAGVIAKNQPRESRMLSRTQHILTSDPRLPDFFDPNTFDGSDAQWYDWRNRLEYDKMSVEEWTNAADGEPNKWDALSVMSGVTIGGTDIPEDWRSMGATVDTGDSRSIHMLLCEGVGEFAIQGWSDTEWRWVPMVDPDGDGYLSDTDFFLDPSTVGSDPAALALHPRDIPGVLYPYPPYGKVVLGGNWFCDTDTPAGKDKFDALRTLLNEPHFDEIPGLGRAIKFTFTLYDSKRVIENGRTFTHIVYLDD